MSQLPIIADSTSGVKVPNIIKSVLGELLAIHNQATVSLRVLPLRDNVVNLHLLNSDFTTTIGAMAVIFCMDNFTVNLHFGSPL
jgi:hypothetical protein